MGGHTVGLTTQWLSDLLARSIGWVNKGIVYLLLHAKTGTSGVGGMMFAAVETMALKGRLTEIKRHLVAKIRGRLGSETGSLNEY
jgi:hypothetical protein